MHSMDRSSLRSLHGKLSALARRDETPVDGWFFQSARLDQAGHAHPLGPCTPLSPQQTWQGEAAFFRCDTHIPAFFNGKSVYLRFRNGGENLLRVNGEAVQGLDEAHDTCLLCVGAGQTLSLEIEAAPRWQHLAHARQFGMEPQPALFSGASLFTEDPDIRFVTDLISCLMEADALPEWQAELRYLVHPDEPFENVRSQCVQARALYGPRLAEMKKTPVLTLCGHSHLDLGYLWPLRETRRKALRTFSGMLALLERYPDWSFAQSQTALYRWVQADDPALFRRVQKAIRDGRWEVVGGMYVEADANLPAPESLIRQFLHGISYCQETLGVRPRVAWLPDTFGLPASLPQILAGCGMRALYTAKIRANVWYDFPFTNYRWEGVDGTRILAHLAPFGTYSGDMTCGQIRQGMAAASAHPPAASMPYMIGLGDGGGGVTDAMIRRAAIWPAFPDMPGMAFGSCEAAFDRINQEEGLPIWREEMYADFHQGTLTSQAVLKQRHRRAESALFQAELLDTVTGAGFAGKLKDAWEKLLLCQFHDILPGSCQRSVVQEALGLLDQVLRTAEQVTEACCDVVTVADPTACTIINPHSFSCPAPADLLSLETLPPFAVVGARPVPPPKMPPLSLETADSLVMENAFVRVTVDRVSGAIVQIFDHRQNRSLLSAPARPSLHRELYEFYDAWNLHPDTLNREISLPAPTVFLLRDDGWQAVVSVRQPVGERSELLLEIILNRDDPQIGLHFRVDWQEKGMLLRYLVPTALYARQGQYDLGYGSVSRSTGASQPFERAQFEVCTQKWMDLSDGHGGIALLNDGKYGGVIKENVMSQSLLKAPGYPDPQADQGIHTFCLALLPHTGNFAEGRVHEAACLLNLPILRLPGRAPRTGKPLLPWQESKGLCVGAVKTAWDQSGDWILRLYENHGAMGSTCLDFSRFLPVSVARCDLMEHPLCSLPMTNGSVSLSFHAFEIVTLRLRFSSSPT